MADERVESWSEYGVQNGVDVQWSGVVSRLEVASLADLIRTKLDRNDIVQARKEDNSGVEEKLSQKA